ncbi:MAG: hypothetical protein MUE30_05720, partial [Spirosomaceae bacterium]|nr:hypothetical protein [Spirosomataceae bacterium]
MALGKKSKSTAEIGDLVTVKVNTATLYDDVDGFYSNDDVTFGAKLGPILAIATSENGELVYSVRGGWVKALAVRIETNPSYNYPESA